MKFLIVVDMQNDFIDGSLGTEEAQAIVPRVIVKIVNFDGMVLATRDTHGENYEETLEGHKLPVKHCIKGTEGWEISKEIRGLLMAEPIDKAGFGSVELCRILKQFHKEEEPIESITLIGLCTDICVIANAMMLKSFLPDVPIIVDASCCAGVNPLRHQQALGAMRACQIDVINDYEANRAPGEAY
ncbi:MAG: cysteine hydrolase [Eubacterium sp.]|nr:cysteine hydrolase [Eubacterium sp.]